MMMIMTQSNGEELIGYFKDSLGFWNTEFM